MLQTYRRGDRVVFNNSEFHKANPRWYPPAGTVGIVLYEGIGTVRVKWPEGTTAEDGCWYSPMCALEMAKEQPESLVERYRDLPE